MGKTRITWYGTVKSVEERIAKTWVSGSGEHYVSKDHSEGFFVFFFESPIAMYAGKEPPEIKIGDRVKISAEVV